MAATALMVWIDQDLCTGDGICSEICPDVFVSRDDGLWVVKEEASHFGSTIIFDGAEGAGHGPDFGKGVARIPDSLIDTRRRRRRGMPRRVHHDRAVRPGRDRRSRRLSAVPPDTGAAIVGRSCGCSSVVEHQLPKLRMRVRFPSSAPKPQVSGCLRKARNWPYLPGIDRRRVDVHATARDLTKIAGGDGHQGWLCGPSDHRGHTWAGRLESGSSLAR